MSQEPILFLDLITAEQHRKVATAIDAFAEVERRANSGPDSRLLASA